MGVSVQFSIFFHCCHLKKWLQQQPPQEDAQSWPHGVHLFGLREFADEVHVGIVVDLWIHGISMGSFKSELTMDKLDKFEAGNHAVAVSLWIPWRAKKTSWFGKHLLTWPVRWSSYLVGHPNAAKKYKGFYRGTSSALHLLLGMWLNAIVQMLLQRRPEYHGSALFDCKRSVK